MKAVVDHITQILPTPGEGLWEHLSNDYIKALKSLLGYPAHVEHLVDEWRHLVKFCLRGIGASENDEGSQLTIRSSQRFRSESADVNSGRSTPIRAVHGQTSRRARVDSIVSKGTVTDFLICIQHLTSSSNAPILSEAESLLNNLTDYLTSSSISASTSQQPAFSSFNAVLARTITDNTNLTQSAIMNIITTIRQLWSTKSAPLKEEMLVTLTLGKSILARLCQHSPSDVFVDALQGLLEHMRLDYVRRLEKERLQIDDLVLSPGSEVLPMGLPGIAPRLGHSSAEQNWTTVWTIASLSILLDRLSASSNVRPSADTEPNKKPRLLSRSKAILDDASSSSGPDKICGLQLTPFLVAESQIASDSLTTSLGHLTTYILDDNNIIASWTMVAIARFVCIYCQVHGG